MAAPVQYGPRVAAAAVYLYTGQFLSEARAAQALAELLGVPLSAGTVAAFTTRAAAGLGGFGDEVRGYLATAARHGIHFFDALVRLAESRPWMPATA